MVGFVLNLVLPGAAALNYFINKRIEDESNKKITDNESQCQTRVKDYVVNCLKSLDKVQGVLKADLNEDKVSKCLKEVDKFKLSIQEYVEKYDTAQVMVKWLDKSELRKKLIIKIVTETKERFNINNDKFDKAFGSDIGKCVNWLRDSIDILGSHPIDSSYMTQALNQISIKKSVYRYALKNVIYEHFQEQKELENMCIANNVSVSYALRILQEYTEKLLQKIGIDN